MTEKRGLVTLTATLVRDRRQDIGFGVHICAIKQINSFTQKSLTMKNIAFLFATLFCTSLFGQTTYSPYYNTNIPEMKIKSIKILSNRTLVNFDYRPDEDGKMYISSGTYIQESNNAYGRKYYIKAFVDHQLDNIYRVYEGDSHSITFEFPKLPAGITKIDIREPDVEEGWNPFYWKNITINNLSNNIAYTSSSSYTQLQNGYYGHGNISSGQYSYYKYYVPQGKMAVFTLKNTSKTSDVDLYLYTDAAGKNFLNKGANGGTKKELISISPSSYGRYVYIKVKNDGSSGTKYKLNAHTVDFAELAGEAFGEALVTTALEEGLKWLLGVEENNHNYDENERNISRASNVILSGIKGENLGNTTKSFFINELTSEIKDEFGTGFWGNLAVNYSIKTADEIYKYYW